MDPDNSLVTVANFLKASPVSRSMILFTQTNELCVTVLRSSFHSLTECEWVNQLSKVLTSSIAKCNRLVAATYNIWVSYLTTVVENYRHCSPYLNFSDARDTKHVPIICFFKWMGWAT